VRIFYNKILLKFIKTLILPKIRLNISCQPNNFRLNLAISCNAYSDAVEIEVRKDFRLTSYERSYVSYG